MPVYSMHIESVYTWEYYYLHVYVHRLSILYMLCININSILPRYTPLNKYILPPYVVY
jgi:hypothetical protein